MHLSAKHCYFFSHKELLVGKILEQFFLVSTKTTEHKCSLTLNPCLKFTLTDPKEKLLYIMMDGASSSVRQK